MANKPIAATFKKGAICTVTGPAADDPSRRVRRHLMFLGTDTQVPRGPHVLRFRPTKGASKAKATAGSK